MISIKPHHFVDILTALGEGRADRRPHPNGLGVHRATREILARKVVKQLLLLPILLVCVAATAEATLQESEVPTIVCHGDSITAGANLADEEKYPEILKTLVPHSTVFNAGIGGNTSAQGLARLEKDVLSHNPNLVILLFGTNDSVLTPAGQYRVPVEKYRENLRQMILRCRKAKAEVILCTLLPIIPEPYFTRHPKEFYDGDGGLETILHRYRTAAMEVGKELQVPVVDLYQTFEKDLTMLRPAPDGVHPNARGAAAIAREIAKLLSPERKPVTVETAGPRTEHGS